MSAASKSIIPFLCWTINILVSRGGDGNLLHELHVFKAETRKAQNNTFVLPFFLICTAFIGLVSCLPRPYRLRVAYQGW
jgi:hypothetical protein